MKRPRKRFLLIASLALAALIVAALWRLNAVRSSEGKAGIVWANIPGGTFTMGADDVGPDARPHSVKVAGFQMAKTLTTNKQYRECVAAGACTAAHASDGECLVYSGAGWSRGRLPESMQGDDQPVVCVDWKQAQAFSKWAGGRLPSEAEWEYAARSAGKDRKYPWGDADPSCEYAIVIEKGPGCARNATWPVCSKPAGNTEQGLCDMGGNAWEFVQDWYHPSYDGAPTDGRAWDDAGTYRVTRGGAWVGDNGELRTQFRYYDFFRGESVDMLSFRAAR